MDFFKSVFSDPDPDPTTTPSSPPPPPAAVAAEQLEPEPAGSTSSPVASAGGGGWGFGGLLKTFTSQSETVLQAYRRDLAEFGTGLRRETDAIREAAARAARDLPASAPYVGHALDGLAGIVAHGKDALLAAAAAAAPDPDAANSASESEPNSAGRRRYSRFEAQVSALQADPATFTSDPDDGEEFASWKAEFDWEARREEIEALCYENDALEGMMDRLVPDSVDNETFWMRYFYRVHKLKQAEDARAKLVKRVIAREDEEEDLSWEVEEEEEEEEKEEEDKKGEEATEVEESKQEEVKETKHEAEESKDETVVELAVLEKEPKNAETPQAEVFGSSMVVVDKKESAVVPESCVEESLDDKKGGGEESNSKSGDAELKEGPKQEASDSSKESDYSMVSSQPVTADEEDLEWDEIEDLGEHDEKKAGTPSSSSAAKEELRKRLSVAEDDEDLSWDIEEDDEKA